MQIYCKASSVGEQRRRAATSVRVRAVLRVRGRVARGAPWQIEMCCVMQYNVV